MRWRWEWISWQTWLQFTTRSWHWLALFSFTYNHIHPSLISTRFFIKKKKTGKYKSRSWLLSYSTCIDGAVEDGYCWDHLKTGATGARGITVKVQNNDEERDGIISDTPWASVHSLTNKKICVHRIAICEGFGKGEFGVSLINFGHQWWTMIGRWNNGKDVRRWVFGITLSICVSKLKT